jgi:hypothetical protein
MPVVEVVDREMFQILPDLVDLVEAALVVLTHRLVEMLSQLLLVEIMEQVEAVEVEGFHFLGQQC